MAHFRNREQDGRGRVPGLDRLARTLSIEPGEGLRTSLLFGLLFAGSMVFVMGRTARDALFLTRFPVTWIAYMWVAYGLVSAVVAVGYGFLSSRFDRERFVIGFTIAAACSYAVVRVLIGAEVRWAFAFFYVWAEIIANLTIVQAWTITNDLHDPRSAKRLFGLIGAGRIVGMLLSGFVTGAIVRAIGTANLMIVIVGWMAVFAVLVRVIARRYPLPGAPPRMAAGVQTAQPMGAQHKQYAFLISCMLLAAFIALTVGDYQFKAIAKLSYPNTDDLAAYMAGFYAAMGAIAFVFQVFATPLILRGLGVLAGLAVMPLAFLSSTIVLIFAPVLASATALKLSDNGMQYTIHDATMQVLYFAFPASLRSRVRALLDATIKPLGYSLGGVALVLLSPSPAPGETDTQLAARIAQVGFLTLGLGLVWVGLTPLVRKAYVEALRSSLVRRQSDVSEETDVLYDSTLKQVLTEALRSGEPAQIVYAADRLADADPDTLRAEIPALLRHPDPTVRATALRKAAALNSPDTETMARAALEDPDPKVCAAAIESLGSTLQDGAVDVLAPMVHDDANRMRRDAAIASLVSHAGLDGILVAGSRLQSLVNSEQPVERAAAARILGDVGQRSLARTLRRLMRDPELSVRRAAFRAAAHCTSPSILPELIEALADRKLARAAARALENLGQQAVRPLADALADEATHRGARLFIPHILHQLGGQASLEALSAHIDDGDEGVRQKVLASASRLREALHAPGIAPERLRPLIHDEMQAHIALREGYLAARPWFARPLLDAQIRLELRGHIVRVMRLCELAWSREHVAAARAGILSSDPTRRANALEVLDNVVDREAREAMLDSLGRFAAATAFSDAPAVPSADPPDEVDRWVAQRIAMPGLYRRAVLFEAIGVRELARFAPLAFRFVHSDHAFMREAALIALAACKPEGWREVMSSHAASDDCPIVREYSSYVIERGSAGLDPEDDMYTTVEKILFLQGVPLFADVIGQDLLPLARSATILRLARGAVVFRVGDPGDSLYVVVHGKVAMTGSEGEVALLGEGEVFGEMAILDEEPRMMGAVVREDADLLRVSAEDFRNALEDTPEVATGVIRVLSQRLRSRGDRTQVLTTDDSGRKTVI